MMMHKKRSNRISNASRMSLANLMNLRSFSTKSSVGSSRTIGGLVDSRCYKHSPRVVQHHTYIGEELANFEAEQWRSAFSAMGGLRKRGEKAPKPFTVLNKAPYHCASLGRQFDVRYGEMIKLQPPVFRKAKKADRPQICNCITKEVLPVLQEKKITGPFNLQPHMPGSHQVERTKYYLPKSCVSVCWDPHVHSSVDKICEWLVSCFGPFIFTTRAASNSLLVVFETMDQAKRAVTFPMMKQSKITIMWADLTMYNFGNYMKYLNYSVNTDPIWKRSIEEKSRSRPIRMTQTNLDTAQKNKRLRIREGSNPQ